MKLDTLGIETTTKIRRINIVNKTDANVRVRMNTYGLSGCDRRCF